MKAQRDELLALADEMDLLAGTHQDEHLPMCIDEWTERLRTIAASLPEPSAEVPDEWARKLSRELSGVVVDVENGNGFDAVCLQTIKRVECALLARRASNDARDTARLNFMERLCAEGCAPAIVNDDDGRWAFSDSSTSPAPRGDGPHNEWVSVTAFVEPAMWRGSIREAIDAALSTTGAQENSK